MKGRLKPNGYNKTLALLRMLIRFHVKSASVKHKYCVDIAMYSIRVPDNMLTRR